MQRVVYRSFNGAVPLEQVIFDRVYGHALDDKARSRSSGSSAGSDKSSPQGGPA